MKKILTLSLLCFCVVAFAQEIKRENIFGKIIVEGNDIEGITIFNAATKMGTVTNELGEFSIEVGSNDLIEIRAVEYKQFDIKINNDIITSKKINVFLIEEVNVLDEVVVQANRLTGNLKADSKRIKSFNPKQDAIYFGVKTHDNINFNKSTKSNNQNVAVNAQPQTLVHGLDIINVVDQLLIPLFRSEVKDKKKAGVPDVPASSIKYYLGSNFLVDNFKIPAHRVEEFIRYVEDDTFDFNLLNYGNELEFLDLLYIRSQEFLKTKKLTF